MSQASSSFLSSSTSPSGGPHRVGLVLSGGGARGAYQAGVIKAIAEIAESAGLKQPIPVITGVSAGAINAAYLAATCDDILDGALKLATLWSELTSEKVFRTDVLSASASGLRLVTDATFGALYKRKLSRSLLDTSPLNQLIAKSIPYERIATNLRDGFFDALAVTAVDYTDSCSVTFVQAAKDAHLWSRSRRRAEFAKIAAEHVIASASIPLFFPPGKIGNDHYGDGCLRNTAPLSPAIHLDATRLLVVSVRRPDSVGVAPTDKIEPSLARILGIILNALFLDAIDVDMERLNRVNQTVLTLPEHQREELQLNKIESLWLRPSVDLGHLAGELFDRLPKVIRYLVGGLGSAQEAAELTSYLHFDPDYCGQLVKIGYEDGMAQRYEILDFLKG